MFTLRRNGRCCRFKEDDHKEVLIIAAGELCTPTVRQILVVTMSIGEVRGTVKTGVVDAARKDSTLSENDILRRDSSAIYPHLASEDVRHIPSEHR